MYIENLVVYVLDNMLIYQYDKTHTSYIIYQS